MYIVSGVVGSIILISLVWICCRSKKEIDLQKEVEEERAKGIVPTWGVKVHYVEQGDVSAADHTAANENAAFDHSRSNTQLIPESVAKSGNTYDQAKIMYGS